MNDPKAAAAYHPFTGPGEPMSTPDLIVTMTIPQSDEGSVTINVQGEDGATISEPQIVYYLFQAATTILSGMPDDARAKTIESIEEFFQ